MDEPSSFGWAPISRRTATTLLGAALLRAPSVALAQTGLKIRMGAINGDTNSEPYFAAAIHAFERAGLDVEVITFTSGGALMQACAGGALDIGMGDLIQISHAVEAGVPFAVFAGASLYVSDAPFTVLITAKDGPIHTPKDFEGRAIGLYSLRSLAEFATREWLRQGGADPDAVNFVEIPASAMGASVERGTVAGATAGEPYLSSAKGSVNYFGKPYDAIAKRFILSSFYARRDWLATNAAAIHKLIGAIYETARWANTHQGDTAPILAEVSKIDVDVVRKSVRAQYATDLSPQLLQPVLDIALKYKALPTPIAVNDLLMRT